MTYAEFKQNFLPEFRNIKSFNGKVKYAKERLGTPIGSGTGRIVFDIDGEKVLKLAKNTKGIAQNEAEANAGFYKDTHDIVAIVFDSEDDNSWLISEKAKKVNERRIIQLTDIPSLNDLFYYVKDYEASTRGDNSMNRYVDPDVRELLKDNEFANLLTQFIANYNQNPGDYGRPSTYGEVLRGGQPTIVLTDYGLNDEVYNTYYNRSRNRNQRIYELYNFADGNDDMLSDIGNTGEVRHGMWGLVPYGVGDGDGVINEDFISFVLNRDKYPTRTLPSAPYIVDEFHDVVNNLNEVLKHVGDKKKFYNNLLELQDYLIRGKFYDREPLEKQEVVLNEDGMPVVDRMTLTQEYTDTIVNEIATKLGLGQPSYLGGAGNGIAYLVNGNKVLKLTTDASEIDAGLKLVENPGKHLVRVYKMYKIFDTTNNKTFYALIEDYIANKPIDTFEHYKEVINSLDASGDNALYFKLLHILIKTKGDREFTGKVLADFSELAKQILTNYPEANISQEERQNAYNFEMELYDMKNELLQRNINSKDFMTLANLGYLNGVLTFFDIGGYVMKEPGGLEVVNIPENVELEEDASAKFSTDDSVGSDDFPAYNQDVISPSINNNLNPNSSMYNEDLEYHHAVGDATQDKFALDERDKSFGPNSKSVEVKQKCRLAGNGNTSTACNQGDISNLNIKAITTNIYDSTDVNTNEIIFNLSALDPGYRNSFECCPGNKGGHAGWKSGQV